MISEIFLIAVLAMTAIVLLHQTGLQQIVRAVRAVLLQAAVVLEVAAHRLEDFNLL